MLRNVLGVTAASFVVTLVAAGGCGGQIEGADGGGGGCTVPGGTYLEHFVAESPSCPALQDTTYTFNATTTLSAAVDAGVVSSGCTVDVTGCTVTYACTQPSGSYTIQMNESLSYASDGTATGKVTETVTGNNVSTTCTYDVTVSKK